MQMLSGKDRGKQGRIIDAQPRTGRVIVENLNQITRHTKPQADARRRPHGRHADDPGRPDRAGRRRRCPSRT